MTPEQTETFRKYLERSQAIGKRARNSVQELSERNSNMILRRGYHATALLKIKSQLLNATLEEEDGGS